MPPAVEPAPPPMSIIRIMMLSAACGQRSYQRCLGIDEALKSSDPMKWVWLMNLARVEAEHNIFEEILSIS